MKTEIEKVYLVEVQIFIFRQGVVYDTVYRVRGIFTTREQAEEVARSYDTSMTAGYVKEVELNREYNDL